MEMSESRSYETLIVACGVPGVLVHLKTQCRSRSLGYSASSLSSLLTIRLPRTLPRSICIEKTVASWILAVDEPMDKLPTGCAWRAAHLTTTNQDRLSDRNLSVNLRASPPAAGAQAPF